MGQETESLNARQYVELLQRRVWIIVLAALVAAGSAYAVSRRSTPIYEASATLLISEGQAPNGPNYDAIMASERLARTYSELLKGAPVLDEVKSRLALPPGSPALEGLVGIELVRDTQLIRVRVRHPDPSQAARIANAVAEVFIEQHQQRQSRRLAGSAQGLDREMAALQAQIDATYNAIEAADLAIKAERAAKTPAPAELARLDSMLAGHRSSYASLLQAYEEIRAAKDRGQVGSVSVVEAAQVPARPILPRAKTNAALAGLVAATLAIGALLGIDRLAGTVWGAEEIERAVQLPNLATIVSFRQPRAARRVPVTAAQPGSAAAEGYRMLRTALQYSRAGKPKLAGSLLVSSAQPGEGKTTTVANLGVTLAGCGKRVLLVDADLRCPGLHAQFGLPNEAGLASLLLGPDSDPAGAIRRTAIDGLYLLTAGPTPPNPAELLGRPTTGALIDRLRPGFDHLLFDSPPVLSAADASILARAVDEVLLVAEVGRTRIGSMQRAVADLRHVRASVVGVVLNRVRPRRSGYYYSQYRSLPILDGLGRQHPSRQTGQDPTGAQAGAPAGVGADRRGPATAWRR